MDKFPIFENHDQVTCFSCGRKLESEPIKTGLSQGKYSKDCFPCYMKTFYDIKGE